MNGDNGDSPAPSTIEEHIDMISRIDDPIERTEAKLDLMLTIIVRAGHQAEHFASMMATSPIGRMLGIKP
jgi:hypothetical protein